MNKVRVFKQTSDDWFPSYQIDDNLNLVQVSFIPFDDNTYSVCACGGDDFGLEKDFVNEKEAWQCFIEIIGMNDVTIKEL